ncbi:MAG TPA: nucleotidyl transferase AbiEii/AbiGii toxin family protein [Puia sp.]|nr:nucleotidyl transferase AbiEii/AbiGii toxin family protein [Puia sp.]
MIREFIAEYNPQNQQEAEAALREVMQGIALAGLQRTRFFERAAFYGGTALRIFYGLDRFSEDLDFCLLEPDTGFSLEPYFNAIIGEFDAVGMQVSIKEKIKSMQSNVDSAFLKSETVWKELVLEGVVPQAGIQTSPKLKIKLEVDREPPLGFETEEKLLLRPFSFYVKCFALPDLFAGKMHALLFRKWKQRVKGRDWYDLEWYIKKGVPLHVEHFLMRARDTGDWSGPSISEEEIIELLLRKIDSVSLDRVREDIVRFIPDAGVLEIWSPQYFRDLIGRMRFS